MSDLDPSIQRYLAKLDTLSKESTPGGFWDQMLSQFKESTDYGSLDRLDQAGFEQFVRTLNSSAKMGFAFKPTAEGVTSIAQDKGYRRTRRWARVVNKIINRTYGSRFFTSKGTWEHMFALQFMRTYGMLDDYEAFISPLKIKSDMSQVRHYYHTRLIAQLVKEHVGGRPLNVVEIGSGAGNLAYFLWSSGLVNTYTFVDLPEMLLLSARTVQQHVPGANILFEEPPVDADTQAFHFIPSQSVGSLPDSHFDLAINVYSFQEMDEDIRDGYIENVYRICRPGGLFFNINRGHSTTQRDGSTYYNNPLLYPYSASDRVVMYEEHQLQKFSRTRFGVTRAVELVRGAIVNEK